MEISYLRDKKAAALLYKKSMQAPKVVAAGSGKIARMIEKTAKEKGIPVIQNSSLAKALVELDVDSQIPQYLYRTVAKVLIYLYKADKKL